LRDEESRYAESVVNLVGSAASLAVERLEPVILGAARTDVALGVNRRQRDPELGTLVGWNPDAICDRDVATLRIDRVGGDALATVIAYGCHPCVLGPDLAEASSDFVAPLRERVRTWTGGECLFLQGCGGNVFPLEALWDRSGKEVEFAERLALAALTARDFAETRPVEPRECRYQSAIPIAVWRLVPTPEPRTYTLAAAEARVRLPLKPPPPLEEIRSIRAELERRAAELRADGASREAWNPLEVHASWATTTEEAITSGTYEREIEAPIQVLRIGDVGLVALPCEPFCEIGLAIKHHSAAPFTIALGYSNDIIGYAATDEEYAHGGYEPTLSHRHFGHVSPFEQGVAAILTEQAIALTRQLFKPTVHV
jgi:hypothetical protein